MWSVERGRASSRTAAPNYARPHLQLEDQGRRRGMHDVCLLPPERSTAGKGSTALASKLGTSNSKRN